MMFREIRMGMLVSNNFFDALRVTPSLGRGFTADEGRVPGRDAVVVLGYDFWKNTLGESRSISGDVVVINGIDFTVVGVAPDGFTGLHPYRRSSFFVPISMTEPLNGSPLAARRDEGESPLENREARSVVVKGRLKPQASQRAAQAELTTLWGRLVEQYPVANRNRTVAVRSELQERRRDDPVNAMFATMMTALVGIVLMIACANVANLMLGRARARSREIAIRLALGVSRTRLLRQLSTESTLLALLGGALGLGVAYTGISILTSLARERMQTEVLLVVEPQLDARVLLFSLLATVASAVLFGVAPAWQSLKTQLVPSLKSSEPGQAIRHRTIGRNVLVSVQVALSMVLLVAAGMLVDGLRTSQNPESRVSDRPAGHDVDDTALMRYSESRTRGFYRDLVDGVRALPNVASVALTDSIPLDLIGRATVIPEGYQLPRGQENVPVRSAIVDEHYFGTMQIEVVRGRAFTADDNEVSRRVAVVNEAFAETYWPNQDPVGKRIQLDDMTSGSRDDVASGFSRKSSWLAVVGVVETTKYFGIREVPRPFLYQPFAQNPRAQMSLLVETRAPMVVGFSGPLRDVVRALDVNVPVFNLRAFSTFYQEKAIGAQLMLMRVISTMGLVGLALALIGLYGLVAYSVARRTQEIGVRMAMGASKSDVTMMVLRQGLKLSTAGIVVGGIASIGVSRLLAAGMAGLGSLNLATYVIVPVVLIGLTIAASYFPARRAAAVDPLRALRYE